MPKKTRSDNLSFTQEEKFKLLFRDNFASMCVVAYRYLTDTEAAKDAVHDVFAGLWESPTQLDNLTNPQGYLYTLVKNHCLDIIRKQNIRNKYATNQPEKESEEFLETEMLREEIYRQLDQAINQLPLRSREIMRLKMSGLKNQEIADKLNLSINTINTLKNNSYRTLRDILKNKFLICWILFLRH